MNKDEILENARKENKNGDLIEYDAIVKGGNIAMSVGLMCCGIITIVEAIINGKCPINVWIIQFAMETAVFTYKFCKLKKKHELILSIFFGIIAVSFAVVYGLSLGGVINY